VSAESYAHEQFTAACRDPRFLNRLNAFGVAREQVAVVSDSLPVGEALAQVHAAGVLAVLDEDASHGFMLVRVRTDT
jgi:hypothetical protein